MTATATAPAPGRRLAPPTLRALRWLARTYLVVGAWFAGVILVLWAAALLVATRFGDVTVSLAQFSRQGTAWFPFSIGVTIFAGYHVAHVAAGMTRRSLGAATLLASAANAVGLGLLVTGLFALERVLYVANGWRQGVTDQGWFPGEASDLLAVLGWEVLVIAAAQVSGLLVAVTYQRTGPWRGTLALPFTAGPVVGLGWLLSRGVTAEWLTVEVRVGVTLLVTAAMAVVYLALLRGLQLRPPRG